LPIFGVILLCIFSFSEHPPSPTISALKTRGHRQHRGGRILPHTRDTEDVTAPTSSGVPSDAPAIDFNFGKTWRSYLEASAEQRIDGNEEERKRSRERHDSMEVYLKR
jgi:hypothetical protein